MKVKNLFLILILLLSPFSDLLAGQWVKKENLGGVARHRATGVSIGQKGYIGLGHVNGTGVNFAFSDWWEFEPATNSWTQKADYLLGQDYGTSAFSVGTKGYVGSGVFIGSSWCEYDPGTNQWSLIATPPASGSELSAISIGDKGYLIENSNIYEYDPVADQWSTKATAPVSFDIWGAAFSIGNSGYIISGSLFYEYKASADQWLARASFPGLSSGGSVAFSVLEKGYVVAGYGVGWLSDVNRETWAFDPSTNSWTEAEEFLGSARRFLVGFSIGDRGYLGTGTNGTNFKDFWEYDPMLVSEEEIENDITVKTYPNPTADFFTVSIKGPFTLQAKAVFLLYDNLGRVVKQNPVTESTFVIDAADLPRGNYIYRIASKSKNIKQGKIIII